MKYEDTLFEEIAGVLKVLGHPDRLRILACLSRETCYVNDLAGKLEIPQSTVSQHLRLLADKNILVYERIGNKVCYSLADSFARILVEKILPVCKK